MYVSYTFSTHHKNRIVKEGDQMDKQIDDQSIRAFDEQRLAMIDRIREAQSKKVSGAATPETDETH